jgi:hypothetical protein
MQCRITGRGVEYMLVSCVMLDHNVASTFLLKVSETHDLGRGQIKCVRLWRQLRGPEVTTTTERYCTFALGCIGLHWRSAAP